MIGLALASVRGRLGGFIGLFLTSCLTVALLTVGGLLMFSALTSGPGPDRFAAASLTVARDRAVTLTTHEHRGKGRIKTKSKTKPLTGAAALPADLPPTLANVDGVREAVPDYAFPVDVATRSGERLRGPHDSGVVVAHGWESAALTPYVLRAGTPPRSGQVVMDALFAGHVGDRVQVSTKTGVRSLRVSGITSKALDNQGAVFLADSDVRAVSGLSGPTAVAVLADRPTDVSTVAERLRPRLGGARVYAGADRVRADLPGGLTSYVPAVSIFGLMLAVTGFAALFVLIGSVGIVVSQRLRELALLRTAGATPRQLLRILAVETGLVALVAGIPGAAIGVLVAGFVASRFRAARIVPAQFAVSTSPLLLGAAVAAGALIAILAAFLAARRAARIAPVEALREAAVAPRGRVLFRLLPAALLTAGAASVLTFVPLGTKLGEGMSFISCALLLCAAVAVGPLLVRLAGGVLAPMASAAGVTGRLAAATVRANSRRVAAVAMPLMLLVGLAATLLLTSTLTVQVAERQQAARTAAADTHLAPTRSGVPLSTADEIARLSGVTGAAATLPTTIMVDAAGKPEHYAAQGLMLEGTPPLDLDVRHGSLANRSDDDVAISADLASSQHWALGDEIGIWLADATTASLHVVAVYDSSRGFGDLVLPARLVADHDPRGLVRNIYLAGRPPTTAGLAAWPVRDAHTDADPVTGGDAATQQTAFTVMTVILVAFIGIAVANAFALSITARRREFADLRLAGATAGQLRRMVDHETILSILIGLVLGCAVAAAVFGAFGVAQDGRWHWISAPSGYAMLVGGTAALGLLAGAVPARLVIRRRALVGDDVRA